MERNNDQSPGVGVIESLPSMNRVWEPVAPFEIKNAMPSSGTAPGSDEVKAHALSDIPLCVLHRVFIYLFIYLFKPE